MPRQPRLDLPGLPVHVTQRGVNRCAIFLDDDDRRHYRRLLRETCSKYAIAIHAFVLMDNHVHMLLTPNEQGALACAMRSVGQNHVGAFNLRHARSGALWQGRYKSSLVDTDNYLLQVIRYIELNPVRAAMVSRPDDYRWSSVHTHFGLARDPLITPHPTYMALGENTEERARAYKEWLREGMAQCDLSAIRRHMVQERVLGDQRFQQMVEKALNRPVACRPRGRPRKPID